MVRLAIVQTRTVVIRPEIAVHHHMHLGLEAMGLPGQRQAIVTATVPEMAA